MANPHDTIQKVEQVRKACFDFTDEEFQEAFNMLLETGDHRKASRLALIASAAKTIRMHTHDY